jgi:hypothetical protein
MCACGSSAPPEDNSASAVTSMQPAAATPAAAGAGAPTQPASPGTRAATGAAGTPGAMTAKPGAAAPASAAAGSGAASAAAGAGAAGATSAAAAGAAGSATSAAAGGGAAGATAAAGTGAAGAAGTAGTAASSVAAELHELFLDVACDAATRAPLEQGATCNHPAGTQRIEKLVTLGGTPGTKYQITLRVRGIWEPTDIRGGMRADMEVPFTVGGQIAGGAGGSSDAINYQQYFIEVAEPKQTYWLNNYEYVAHDIHKEDYEASITASGGSQIKVVMNDGNEREIANFPKEMFSDVPPYDKMPSLGQSLRLDVLEVAPAM